MLVVKGVNSLNSLASGACESWNQKINITNITKYLNSYQSICYISDIDSVEVILFWKKLKNSGKKISLQPLNRQFTAIKPTVYSH